MPVQASLLDDQIPMSASRVDIPAAVGEGMDMVSKQIDVSNQVQQNQDAQKDRQVLQNYQGDLYSLDGIKQASQDLKGQLSLNGYARLQQQAQALQQHDVEMRQKIANADATSLKNIVEKNNVVFGQVLPALESYKSNLASGGKQDADAKLQVQKTAILQNLAAQKDQNGQPMFDPAMLQQLQGMDADQLGAAARMSKSYHDLAETRWKESQIDANEASVEQRKANAKRVKDSPLSTQVKSLMALQAEHPEIAEELQGTINAILSIPAANLEKAKAGAKEATAKAAAADAKANAAAALTPEGKATLDKMFERGTVTAGNLRGATTNPVLIELFNRLGAAGADPSSNRAVYGADVKSLKEIVPKYDAIKAFENNTSQQGEALKVLAHKVDETGIPVMERWIRAGRREIEGDTDVTAFNTQLGVYAPEVAKILTNPNLSGVLSDQARQEVKSFIPNQATAKQVDRVVDLLNADFKRREYSLEDQISTINDRIAGKKDIHGKATEKSSPGSGQVSNDERVTILQQEYEDENAKAAKADSPERKQEHLNNAKETEKELKKLGAAPRATAPTPTAPAPAASAAPKKLVYDPATGKFK